MNIEKELFKLQDKKYQSFQKKLCPGNSNIIGIKVPILREFAKNNKDLDLKRLNYNYFEEIMLRGMIIGMQKEIDYNQIIGFLPYIDNWAVCDTFCAGLKQIKKQKKEFIKFIVPYLKSKKQFEVRFAVVILLDYYICEEYIDEVLVLLKSVKQQEYYAKMAVAWCYSTCFIKFYEKTLKFFEENKLDEFVKSKSIQKALESFRITDEQKNELKQKKY